MPQVVLLHEEHKKFVWKMAALVAAAGVVAIILLILTINMVWASQHTQAVNNAKALDSKHQYSAEVQSLQHYVDTNPPRQFKYDALVKLADAASNNGDNHTAFESYLSADELSVKPNRDLKLKVANFAAAVGDKATAISYYKQAVSLTPKSDTDQIDLYQDEMRSLEAAQ